MLEYQNIWPPYLEYLSLCGDKIYNVSYYLSCHLSLQISVLKKLLITLNLMRDYTFFDTQWPTTFDSQALETLVQLISLLNLKLRGIGHVLAQYSVTLTHKPI